MKKGFLLAVVIFYSQISYSSSVHVAVLENHEALLNTQAYGVSWWLLQQAANLEGISLIPVENRFRGSVELLDAGKIDLLFGVLKDAEREKKWFFSHGLGADFSAVYTFAENKAVRLSDIDLNTAMIGVPKSTIQERYADKLGFKNIYPIENSLSIYKMLNSKRIEYVLVANSFVAHYCSQQISKTKGTCLKMVGEPVNYNYSHFATSKNNKRGMMLVKRLNEHLLTLQKSRSAKKEFLHYGYDEDDYESWLQLSARRDDTSN